MSFKIVYRLRTVDKTKSNDDHFSQNVCSFCILIVNIRFPSPISVCSFQKDNWSHLSVDSVKNVERNRVEQFVYSKRLHTLNAHFQRMFCNPLLYVVYLNKSNQLDIEKLVFEYFSFFNTVPLNSLQQI